MLLRGTEVVPHFCHGVNTSWQSSQCSTPSQYLKQRWLNLNWILGNKFQWNWIKIHLHTRKSIKTFVYKMAAPLTESNSILLFERTQTCADPSRHRASKLSHSTAFATTNTQITTAKLVRTKISGTELWNTREHFHRTVVDYSHTWSPENTDWKGLHAVWLSLVAMKAVDLINDNVPNDDKAVRMTTFPIRNSKLCPILLYSYITNWTCYVTFLCIGFYGA